MLVQDFFLNPELALHITTAKNMAQARQKWLQYSTTEKRDGLSAPNLPHTKKIQFITHIVQANINGAGSETASQLIRRITLHLFLFCEKLKINRLARFNNKSINISQVE